VSDEVIARLDQVAELSGLDVEVDPLEGRFGW
jgi:hypothetical protein